MLLAQAHLVLVDEHVEHAGVLEVEQRRHQRQARHRLLAARIHHCERIRDERAADTEAERVDLLRATDLLHHMDRSDHALLEVVVPGDFRFGLVRVLPRHHEHRVALLGRIADERVLRLQVEDVELVDARRHQQERPLIDLLGQRLVLDQLEQHVLVDDRAFAGRDVLADFEAVSSVCVILPADVLQQVVHPHLQAFAVRLEQRLLRLRIGPGSWPETRRRPTADTANLTRFGSWGRPATLSASLFRNSALSR